MKQIFKAALVSSIVLAGSHSFAQSADATANREAVVDQREANQEKRIDQGVKSGQLTPAEAAKLQKKKDKIKAQESKDVANGKMTKKDFKKLEKEQNQASAEIAKKKHNKRKE